MNQEDKQLLFKDLSSRLPYGVKCTTKSIWNGIYTIVGYKDNRFFLDCPIYNEGDDEWMIASIVPYLRPMSSMTEEEKKEMHEKLSPTGTAIYKEEGISTPFNHYGEWIPYEYMSRIIDWLLKNHFDYCGLIDNGLAIAVTEENNPYKE